jgi:hypothetical protein
MSGARQEDSVILTTFIAAAFMLASPTVVGAEQALGLAPVSMMQGDSDSDSDRHGGRGRGGIFGRGNGDFDGDSDSDSDSDSDDHNGNGRRADNCIDINRDGRCDFGTGRSDNRRNDNRRNDRRRDGCIDNNRDGRCDFGLSRSRGGLPDMISAVMASRGQRSMADQWLPRGIRNVRFLDRDRNRVPERATFLDGAGRIAQV